MFGVSIYADEIIVCPGEKKTDDLSYFPSSVPLPMAVHSDVLGKRERDDAEDLGESKRACAEEDDVQIQLEDS